MRASLMRPLRWALLSAHAAVLFLDACSDPALPACPRPDGVVAPSSSWAVAVDAWAGSPLVVAADPRTGELAVVDVRVRDEGTDAATVDVVLVARRGPDGVVTPLSRTLATYAAPQALPSLVQSRALRLVAGEPERVFVSVPDARLEIAMSGSYWRLIEVDPWRETAREAASLPAVAPPCAARLAALTDDAAGDRLVVDVACAGAPDFALVDDAWLAGHPSGCTSYACLVAIPTVGPIDDRHATAIVALEGGRIAVGSVVRRIEDEPFGSQHTRFEVCDLGMDPPECGPPTYGPDVAYTPGFRAADLLELPAGLLLVHRLEATFQPVVDLVRGDLAVRLGSELSDGTYVGAAHVEGSTGVLAGIRNARFDSACPAMLVEWTVDDAETPLRSTSRALPDPVGASHLFLATRPPTRIACAYQYRDVLGATEFECFAIDPPP